MEDWREEIRERANLFAAENGRTLIGQLGYGYDVNAFANRSSTTFLVSSLFPATRPLSTQRGLANFVRRSKFQKVLSPAQKAASGEGGRVLLSHPGVDPGGVDGDVDGSGDGLAHDVVAGYGAGGSNPVVVALPWLGHFGALPLDPCPRPVRRTLNADG